MPYSSLVAVFSISWLGLLPLLQDIRSDRDSARPSLGASMGSPSEIKLIERLIREEVEFGPEENATGKPGFRADVSFVLIDKGLVDNLGRLSNLRSLSINPADLPFSDLWRGRPASNGRKPGAGGVESIDDSTMAAIGRLKQIERLSMPVFSEPAVSLRKIANLPELRDLELWGNWELLWTYRQENGALAKRSTPFPLNNSIKLRALDEKCVELIASMPKLERLRLSVVDVDSRGLDRLVRTLNDKNVELHVESLCPPYKFKQYGECRNVVRGSFVHRKPGDLAGLSELVRLETLEIKQCGVDMNDADVREIGRLSRLKSLGLFGIDCKETDGAAWTAIGGLRELETLKLRGADFSEATIRAISPLPALTRLEIESKSLKGELPVEAFSMLRKHPKLESVVLDIRLVSTIDQLRCGLEIGSRYAPAEQDRIKELLKGVRVVFVK